MDSKKQLRLNYPEDFRVACRINNLDQQEVLQYFINKVSFYAFNGGEMDASSLLATNIILECMDETGRDIMPVKEKKIQKIFLKNIGLLIKLSANPHLNLVEKMQESIYLMEEWAMEMLPMVDYETSIETGNEEALMLSFDFNLLCQVNGLDSIRVLQYFIDKISLPIDRAINLRGFVKSESCMVLMQMMLIGKAYDDVYIRKTDISRHFSSRLEELDKRLMRESELVTRIRVYRSFYAEWYNTLQKNID